MDHQRSTPDGRARILVLGDDPTLLGVLEAILRDAGYMVHGALRHGDGYAVVSERQPDLLILDLLFSAREGGQALLEQVQHEPALGALPVLVCCALPAHLLEAHTSVLARHGVSVLLKPFDLEHLLGMVEALLHRQGREPQPPASWALRPHRSTKPGRRARATRAAQAAV
jgi:DNA-binding response OmpR family regulator